MRPLPLAVSFTLLLASVAAAQSPIRRGNEFVVNTYTYYVQRRPDVAAGPDGRFVVAWQSFQTSDGFEFDVFGQRYDSAGGRAGGEFLVNTGTTSRYYAEDQPSVAMVGDGSFVVVWNSGGVYDIVGRRYSTTGAPVGGQFAVSEVGPYGYSEGYQYFPSVAAVPDGRFVVAWGSTASEDGDDSAVVARRFDAAGSPQGSQFVVNTFTTGRQAYPVVAMVPDGRFVVVWEDKERRAIVGRRYDSAGAAQGSEFVASQLNHDYFDAAVAAAPDGSFLVAWTGLDGNGQGMLARRYDSTGTSVGGAFVMNSDTADAATRGVVTLMPDGGFVAAWFSSALSTGNGAAVVGRRFDSSGAPIGGEFVVNSGPDTEADTDYRHSISIAAGGDATFTVVWRSIEDGGDVIGQRFFDGTVGCSATPRTDCREPTVGGRGIFRFKDAANDQQNRLVWQWVKGEATTPADFGDPFSNTAYALCGYDGSASPQPVLRAISPAQGPCGQRLCWQPITGAVALYFDRARAADGLDQIRLKDGTAGRARVGVRGAGPNLSLPATPLTPPVVVQLQGSNGECWSATYSSTILANGGGLFRARPD